MNRQTIINVAAVISLVIVGAMLYSGQGIFTSPTTGQHSVSELVIYVLFGTGIMVVARAFIGGWFGWTVFLVGAFLAGSAIYGPVLKTLEFFSIPYAGGWATLAAAVPAVIIAFASFWARFALGLVTAAVIIGIIWGGLIVLKNKFPDVPILSDVPGSSTTVSPTVSTPNSAIQSIQEILGGVKQAGYVKRDTPLFECRKEAVSFSCSDLSYDFGAQPYAKGIKGGKIVLNNAEMQAILLPNPADPEGKDPVNNPPVLAFAASKWILNTPPAVPQPAAPSVAPAPVPAPAPPAATTPATVTPSPAPGVPPAPIAPTMPTEIKAQITDRTFKVTAALGWLYTLRLDDAPTSNKVNIVLVRGGVDVFTQEFLPRDKIPNDYFLKNVVDGDTLRVDPIPGLERSFVSPSPEKPYVVKLVPTGKY